MLANSSTISSRLGRSRAYLAALLGTVLLLIVTSYVVRVTALDFIAPRFTGNASFDQKLLFIQKQGFKDTPLSIVAGSSMALNNVNADELQRAEGVRYLNSGSWSLSVSQTSEFTALLESHFEITAVTLVVQFFELADGKATELAMSGEEVHNYLSDGPSRSLASASDIIDALLVKHNWESGYGNPRSYEYLGFTTTGSVPLEICKTDIDQDRWVPKQSFPDSCQDCMTPVTNMCTSARKRGVPFLVVLPPLTHNIRLTRADVSELYQDRRQRLAAVVAACGGAFFDVDQYAEFDDNCFADFAHLNADGARRMTELLLQWKRGTLQRPGARVVCAQLCKSASGDR